MSLFVGRVTIFLASLLSVITFFTCAVCDGRFSTVLVDNACNGGGTPLASTVGEGELAARLAGIILDFKSDGKVIVNRC